MCLAAVRLEAVLSVGSENLHVLKVSGHTLLLICCQAFLFVCLLLP